MEAEGRRPSERHGISRGRFDTRTGEGQMRAPLGEEVAST